MATNKVTFTLDAETIRLLRDAAERLSQPQSAVVRHAIQDFHDRIGKLSEQERLRALRTFDELVPKIPSRPLSAVRDEIAEVQRARRRGGRKSPVE